MRLNLGSSGFSVIKIVVVRQVHMLPACNKVWAWRQTPHSAWRLWTHLFCFYLGCIWTVKTRRPPNWVHGWQRHYLEWYRRSGISGIYICAFISVFYDQTSKIKSSYFSFLQNQPTDTILTAVQLMIVVVLLVVVLPFRRDLSQIQDFNGGYINKWDKEGSNNKPTHKDLLWNQHTMVR